MKVEDICQYSNSFYRDRTSTNVEQNLHLDTQITNLTKRIMIINVCALCLRNVTYNLT